MRNATNFSSPVVAKSTFGLCERQSSTGFQDAPPGDKSLARRRGHEVDLEFNGQHTRSRRHEAERGIPGGAVSYRRDRTGMNKTMLLRDRRACRESNFDRSRRNVQDRCARGRLMSPCLLKLAWMRARKAGSFGNICQPISHI